MTSTTIETTIETSVETSVENEALTQLIRAKLRAHDKARPHTLDVGPHAARTLADLLGGIGVANYADQHPARNLAGIDKPMPLGIEMEQARLEGLAAGRDARSASRKAQSRARAARHAQIDAIDTVQAKPDPARMALAWQVVVLMHPTIERIARSKRQQAARYLGDVTGDLTALAEESVALICAKSELDLDVLVQAAGELSDSQRERGVVPGDQDGEAGGRTKEQRAERKRVGQARKWLMSVINRRVSFVLADMFRDRSNLRWENIDVLDTIMVEVNAPGDDPAMANFKASVAPSFMGVRFSSPGGIDGNLIQAALTAAISDRRLDALVGVLDDEAYRRTDGSVQWQDAAEAIFRAAPTGDGEYRWQLVESACAVLERPERAHGKAAKRYAQEQFEWMPGFLVDVIDAFDAKATGWAVHPHTRQAQMATLFESYLPDALKGSGPDGMGVRRYPLRPALSFASREEAAAVLAQHVACIASNEELLLDVLDA